MLKVMIFLFYYSPAWNRKVEILPLATVLISSGVAKDGDTREGILWCHPYTSLQKVWLL